METSVVLYVAIAIIISLVIWLIVVKYKLKTAREKLKTRTEIINLLNIFLDDDKFELLFKVPDQIISRYQSQLCDFCEKMMRQEVKKVVKMINLITEHRNENDFIYRTFNATVSQINPSYVSSVLSYLFVNYLEKLENRALLDEINYAGEKYVTTRNLLLSSIAHENREKLIDLMNSYISDNISKNEGAILIFQAEQIQIRKMLCVDK